jgi:hypothetical protein
VKGPYSSGLFCSPRLQGLPRLGPACQAHGQAFGRPMPAGGGQRARRVVTPRGHGQNGHRDELAASGNSSIFEGKWSLDIDLHAATRKPKRRGWDGGAHRRGGRRGGRRWHR